MEQSDDQLSSLLMMQSRTLGIALTHSKHAVLRGSMDKNLRSIGLHTSEMLVAFTIICERRPYAKMWDVKLTSARKLLKLVRCLNFHRFKFT